MVTTSGGTPVPTPELDKQIAARAQGSQEIGEFIEWLKDQGVVLARWEETDGTAYVSKDQYLQPQYQTTEQWLADYFKIDLTKIEAERRAILAALREED